MAWLALYYIHRCIHQQCLELDHWFHSKISNTSEPPLCERGDERRHAKSRPRSVRREKSRGRSEYKRYQRHDQSHNRGQRNSRDAEVEWPGQMNAGGTRRIMQMKGPTQTQPCGQLCYPLVGWHEQTHDMGQMPYQQPRMYLQGPAQAAQAVPFAMPAASPQQPQQPQPQTATAMPEPAYYPQQYQHPHAETCWDGLRANQPERRHQRSKPSPESARRVNEVDYIHICDEYPPIVLEALERSVPAPSSSSSSSSDVSGTTQEVPRASTPRATTRSANTQPIPYPQYPQLATPAWIPTSCPRQWKGNSAGGRAANAKARYPSYMGMSGEEN